jgi:predicted DNA-binding WGR domain protein
MSKQRLELTEGPSNKFWELEVTGASLTVHFGRIGTAGQTKIKHFATAHEAAEAAAALLTQKAAKGYRAAGALKPLTAAPKATTLTTDPATRFTLILPSNPNSPFVIFQAGKRLVTDSTAQAFRSVSAATEHVERVISLRRKEGYLLQSTEQVPLEELELAQVDHKVEIAKTNERIVVTFREAVTAAETVKLMEQLVREAPRFLQVVCDSASPGRHFERAIAAHPLPSVKSFVVDTPFQTQTRQGENAIGDLAVTFGALPAVERLFANGKMVLTACRHEHLRELSVLGNPLPRASLRELGGCELPSLERLVLSVSSDAGPLAARDAIASVVHLRAPKLRDVFIDGLDDVTAALDSLAAAGLPPSLKFLGLSGSVDEDRLLASLRRHAPLLAALETIALPLGDEVSSEGDEAARRMLSQLRDTLEFAELTLPKAYDGW